MIKRIILLFMLAGYAGCGSSNSMSSNIDDGPTPVSESQYTTTDSGLKFFDFTAGSGTAATVGSVVTVHYVGWLQTGQIFDSSIARGQPFPFTLGVGRVIPGWDEGVEGMRVGGKRQLVIPPGLAYGSRGSGGVIPPNATLIFEVEVLSVE